MRTFLSLFLAFLVAACAAPQTIHTITLASRGGDTTVAVQVEIADTPEARRIGLMNRPQIPENQGMLFAFEEPAVQKFWMQSTLVPLDIMYFTGAGEFINAHTMEPCVTDECPSYASIEPAQFALEMPAGFREEHGIGPGWKLETRQLSRIVDYE